MILIFCQYILTGLKSLKDKLQANRIFKTNFFTSRNPFKSCFFDFFGPFGTLKTRIWFWFFVSIFLQVSKAYMTSYRPTGFSKPIFLPLEILSKIGFLTFLVLLEPLRPEFDSDFLSAYFYRSQKLIWQVTDQPYF